jgi:NAD(P)H dehydrogenase (quinone)
MAGHIAEGVRAAGATATLKALADVSLDELVAYDGIVLGSPSYYGSMAGEVKQFLDATIVLHGQLRGKLGGAFCTAARLSGGAETTLLSIMQAMLVHGMIISGGTAQLPYGPIAVHAPDDPRLRQECNAYGMLLATLAQKLA